MSKRQFLMLLGVLVIIFLFLGMPALFDRILAVVVGFLIVMIAYKMPPEVRRRPNQMPYVEHRSDQQPPSQP